MSGRDTLKYAAHAVAWLLVTPSVVSFAIRSIVIGRDRALQNSTEAWALVPGLIGQYLRRAFLSRAPCAASDGDIEFGTLFSSASAIIGRRAYIGPRPPGLGPCRGRCLIAAGVRPSGPDSRTRPGYAHRGGGAKQAVRIARGPDQAAAVVLADVGAGHRQRGRRGLRCRSNRRGWHPGAGPESVGRRDNPDMRVLF